VCACYSLLSATTAAPEPWGGDQAGRHPQLMHAACTPTWQYMPVSAERRMTAFREAALEDFLLGLMLVSYARNCSAAALGAANRMSAQPPPRAPATQHGGRCFVAKSVQISWLGALAATGPARPLTCPWWWMARSTLSWWCCPRGRCCRAAP
jgi:hypothetical protein